MKKQFFLFIAATLFSISSLMAQEGRQKLTPEQKTKATMEKLEVFKLDATAKAKTESIFKEFYTSVQKSMEEMRASGNMDREATKEKRYELVNIRNGQLKKVLTHEQMRIWVDEIEPTLMPKKPETAPVPNK